MIDFNFYSPTKIVFGKNQENSIGELAKEFNFKRVLIIIGKGSVKESGLLDKVTKLLDGEDIYYSVLSGVRANPEISLCKEGILKAREEQLDSILAIGGGSVIDTAKNIAVGYYYDGDSFDFNRHVATPTKALPIGVILTISAAGSELSNSCVISNDKLNMKAGFNSDIVRPKFAIENPCLTFTVSPYQTAVGIVDIMMHTLGRYIQTSQGDEMSDGFAEVLLNRVVKAGYKVIKDPYDYDARATLMLASSLSHNGLTNIGKPFGLPVHQLEHALSGLYPSVAHGGGLAVLYPAWAKYYLPNEAEKFARLAKTVFEEESDDVARLANKFIKDIEEYFTAIGAPQTYKDLGLEDVDFERLSNLATADKTRTIRFGNNTMDYNDIKKIFILVR